MDTPDFDFAKENVALAPLTYYRVGGPARLALIPRNIEEACQAYIWMRKQPCRTLVLGAGSNVLIADHGFDGIVLITTGLNRIEPLGNDLFEIESGVVLDTVVQQIMIPNNYEGVGGLAGIPGTVGGAVFMNAGTVNGTTDQWVNQVELIGPEGRSVRKVTKEDYGYRGQTFCPQGALILRAQFRFQKSNVDQKTIYEHYIQRRREKQPQGYCCGSVFKNPPGDHAARLIEACGLKGARCGGAVISPIHANFIMNEENATANDILALIHLCKAQVREKFGIDLQEEVVIIR
ncbi:MAG TPA: UDP-N-acetylmuramate dehydrogenase [Candidatus Hydrogenedentes bacterium]|nr:UDP-N-acetylmuramate dehydrogenase [Candidatus Hydrogenedentota bacterium]HOL76092.1 UDP-N-acetylmuramate dehydrogenase [Candidatus Hydrogenedentota bacterium]HPO84706.1 UDP-N-acetylmuramate dehydrogenase [Candidatus Hydrogenedentota bacterium]